MSDCSNLPIDELPNDSKVSDVKHVSSDELFNQGKKLYIVGDYSKSLEFLSQACKMKELESGPLSDEMFEPYYYLAKGYYMYSKYDTALIGEGLEIVKEATEEEENANDLKKDNEEVEERSELSKDEEDGEAKVSKEVLSYLESSYETIECAKLVLKRQKDEKKMDESVIDLRLADCCDLVGNIYMEEGVIVEAINEFNMSLELRQKHLSSNDRSIAESYHNLAVAHALDFRNQEAIDNYEKCKSIMIVCKGNSLDNKKESDELTEILADIDERIMDCNEGERDYKSAKESILQFLKVTPSDLPTNDVTHLVKRKSNLDSTEDSANKLRKLE